MIEPFALRSRHRRTASVARATSSRLAVAALASLLCSACGAGTTGSDGVPVRDSDAMDASDGTAATDASDGTVATDAVDGTVATDAVDAPAAADAVDTTGATDGALDIGEDPPSVPDGEPSDVPEPDSDTPPADVLDVPEVSDAGSDAAGTGPPPEAPPEDFSGVIWLHTDVSDWPVTAHLSDVTVAGGQICMPYDRADVWPVTTIDGSGGPVEIVANPWIFIRHDGQWYAATWEWLRPGQTCKAETSVAGDHIKQPPFRELDWRPTPGETYWFMVSAPARMGRMTVAERSNLSPVVWPGGGGGTDPTPPNPANDVLGYIDRVERAGDGANVVGWACHRGWAGSIDVHLYVGGAAGVGTGAGSATANQASEPAVAAACGSTGTAHRFSISLSAGDLASHQGQPIYVHGISPVGNPNLLIDNSGEFTVPAP